ncbi:MAG: class I SAM-dependent methyltransferase [Opitutaceae bacterium]
MNLATRFIHSFRRRGMFDTFRLVGSEIADWAYDWRHGVRTHPVVDARDFDSDFEEAREHSRRYQPTRARPLQRLLRRLDLPRDSAFVDVGSGMGRVLFVVAPLGFKRVVGVEFAADLCEAARENARTFAARHPKASPIEIINHDAGQYRLKPDESVVYLYNSFDDFIMRKFMEQVRSSLAEHPRDLWLIYAQPDLPSEIEKSGLFPAPERIGISVMEFWIYQHRKDEPARGGIIHVDS